MIDKRLQQDWHEARGQAASTLAEYARLADLELWITTWWSQWAASCPASRDDSWRDDAIGALRASRPVEDDLARAIETRIISRHDEPKALQAAIFVARTFGRMAASGAVSATGLLQIGLRLSLWGMEFFEAFARNIAAGAVPEWIADLSALPTALADCCEGRWGKRESLEIPALEEQHARRVADGERGDLWSHREPREVEPASDVLMRVRALWHLSPAAAMSALERIPSASLRKLFLFFMSLGDDAGALLDALKAAPPLWANQTWTGNGVAPLLIKTLTKHATRIASALERPSYPNDADPTKVDDYYRTEAPAFFDGMTQTLLAREDGRWLAIDYTAELMRRASWSRQQDGYETRVMRIALTSLIKGLQGAGVRPADVQRFSRRRLSADGSWSRATEYLSVAGLMVDSPVAAERVWAEVTAHLARADEEDITGSLHSYLAGTHLLQGLAHALAGTASPGESWLHTWRALYPARERARFAVLTAKGLGSSAYLATVGLAALHWLISKDREQARSMWLVVGEGLRQIAAAPHERGMTPNFHQLVALPWAFAPHVDATSWPGWLNEWRGTLSVDPVVCLMAADFLIRNGVARPVALETMRSAGCDPLALGQDLCDWLEARGFGTVVDDMDVAKLLAQVRGDPDSVRDAVPRPPDQATPG